MKKFKRLLVTLPLGALFIIGSLPVWANQEEDQYLQLKMQLKILIQIIKNQEQQPPDVKISEDGILDKEGKLLEDGEYYYLVTDINKAEEAINVAKAAMATAEEQFNQGKVRDAITILTPQVDALDKACTELRNSVHLVVPPEEKRSYEEIKKDLQDLINKVKEQLNGAKASDDGEVDEKGVPLENGDIYYPSTMINEAKAAIKDAEEQIKKADDKAREFNEKLVAFFHIITNNLHIKLEDQLTKIVNNLNEKRKEFTSKNNAGDKQFSLKVQYYENMKREGEVKEAQRIYKLDGEFVAKHIQGEEGLLNQVAALAKAIKNFVESQLQNGYKPYPNTYRDAAYKLLNPTDEEKKAGKITATVEMGKEVAETVKVIAYDIHHNRFVFDRLYELELRDGWRSPKDASKAFYDNSDTLRDRYLYAGYATREIAPVIIYRGAYLEQIAKNIYIKALNTYKADVVAFVVPRTIDVKTIHTFPEGTRDELIEYVPVPYEAWASLQHSSQFMNLPEIFKTRIQKVNEQGFAFREIAYYNGINPITGLVSGYDWYGFPVAGDGDYDFYARVFYDKAVAAAKEVPSEKKVDAASAPQPQLQAPSAQSKIQAQAQAPVTAANTTTTSAPSNSLPVTGASDSIFLFLSSAALMAVGILFSKKD